MGAKVHCTTLTLVVCTSHNYTTHDARREPKRHRPQHAAAMLLHVHHQHQRSRARAHASTGNGKRATNTVRCAGDVRTENITNSTARDHCESRATKSARARRASFLCSARKLCARRAHACACSHYVSRFELIYLQYVGSVRNERLSLSVFLCATRRCAH